jgi:hypothetical protein
MELHGWKSPNRTVEYFGHVVEVRDQLQLFDSKRSLAGNFSMLSNTLAVRLPVDGFFEGTCRAQ